MSYYILKQSTDKKVIGTTYPQVDCTTMFQAQLISSWHLFDPAPALAFNLRKGSLLTDVLQDVTINSRGFLIGPKVKKVLCRFNLMRHQHFPATVKTAAGELPYSWLHLCEPELSQKLNYKASVFFRTAYTFREEAIEINSFEHYQELKRQDLDAAFGVEADKLVLADEFDRKLDLFTFLPFNNIIFITDRLRQALEAHGITGFTFESTDKIR